MTTYRFVVEVDDDMRGVVESKPWTAMAFASGTKYIVATVAAGLGEEPWEAVADLQVNWENVEEES